MNGEYFQEFLDWLSQELGSDYAILQIDQAPAHVNSAIFCPGNVIPLLQLPHSPELNPIERLWQFLSCYKITDLLFLLLPCSLRRVRFI
ncbi:hypothetical protein NUACC26_017280 [Scytonema sp. NUACC26]